MNRDVRMKGFSRRTPVADALGWVRELGLNPKAEKVALRRAAGRVLAEAIRSRVNVPGFRRAMMDGFAIRAAEVIGATAYNPLELKIAGSVFPGQPCRGDIHPGQAMMVMTGAEVPCSADAVIPVEQCHLDEATSTVKVQSGIAEGKNIARIGEDISEGAQVLTRFRRLRPQDVGLLSSIGVDQVPVFRSPDVRIIVSGNELLPAGSTPRGVQVVDSNSVMLEALVERDGGRPNFPGILPDDRDGLLEAMRSDWDVLLIAGGSSTGQEDFAPTLLAEYGELPIHGIAMRPSSPAGMGRLDGRPVFLLPGNPVSCLCAYDFFAGPAVRILSGLDPGWPYRKTELPLATKLTSAIGRTDYARVRIVEDRIEPIAISGASILSSTICADGFCIVPEDCEGYAEETVVTVYCYDP